MPESIALSAESNPKLRQAFRTQHRVYVTASSGTGVQEAAATRNCVAKRVLHCTNGSFGDRWVQTAIANGKVEVLEAEWGAHIAGNGR